MKKILFIFMLLSYCLKSQNMLSTEQQDSFYLYSINSKLSNFERTRDVNEIHNLHYMAGSSGEIINRNRNPNMWEFQIKSNIIQALQIWNRVANYRDFDFSFDYNKKYEKLKYPSCYKEPKFVYYGNVRMRKTGKIDTSEIKDEKCRKEFTDYYQNVEIVDKEFQYQRGINEVNNYIVLEIINLFDVNKFTSIDEINTFVLPNIGKYIDSERKRQVFETTLSNLILITKQKPVSKN